MDENVADIAIRYLRKLGWTQHVPRDHHGICASHALTLASEEMTRRKTRAISAAEYIDRAIERRRLYDRGMRALMWVIKKEVPWCIAVSCWNDSHCVNVDEVIHGLKLASERLNMLDERAEKRKAAAA